MAGTRHRHTVKFCSSCGEQHGKRVRKWDPVRKRPLCAKRREEYEDKNPYVSCPFCKENVRRSSLKKHQSSGDCLVASTRMKMSALGLVSSHSVNGDLCRAFGLPVRQGVNYHNRGGWGRRSRTTSSDFVPEWVVLVLSMWNKNGGEISLVDKATVLALLVRDKELVNALLAVSAVEPKEEYGEANYRCPVQDMVLAMIPMAREQIPELPKKVTDVIGKKLADDEAFHRMYGLVGVEATDG